MVACVKHIATRCGSCLCTLSASNTSIPCMWTLLASSFILYPYIFFDFCKKSFIKILFMFFFSPKNFMCHPRTCSWCIILARATMNGFQWLVHSALSVFPAKGKSKLHSKRSSKWSSPENFLHTGGCFERNTSRVQALGWLEKKEEERRRWTIPEF